MRYYKIRNRATGHWKSAGRVFSSSRQGGKVWSERHIKQALGVFSIAAMKNFEVVEFDLVPTGTIECGKDFFEKHDNKIKT